VVALAGCAKTGCADINSATDNAEAKGVIHRIKLTVSILLLVAGSDHWHSP
jgi:hypothetical protein